MKQLAMITLTTITISLISGCSTNAKVAPSQNSALNNVTDSGKNTKKGYMQKSLDNWFKEEWTPTVTQDKKIQKKYMKRTVSKNGENNETATEEAYYEEDSNRTFTIQEYVDKAKAYMDAKPNDYSKSNVTKLESMPVIGK